MTLQNRVDPWGNLQRHPSKSATLMGNRGILHDEDKKILKLWGHSNWVSCVTNYKNIKRAVFSANNYSELFFLDEVTAFAAGHRPCGGCQNQRYKQFKKAWLSANHADQLLPIKTLDKIIHSDRLNTDNKKKTFQAKISDLPIGTMFEYEGKAIAIFKGNHYLVWSFDGYKNMIQLSPDLLVKVLTPYSFVQAFHHGFIAEFHYSATNTL